MLTGDHFVFGEEAKRHDSWQEFFEADPFDVFSVNEFEESL